MAYIGKGTDLPEAKLRDAEERVVKALDGLDSTIAGNAALLVGIAICLCGGATKDQVIKVATMMVNEFDGERSN